ncbi:RNA-directed DNA polymerase from mobile element jockey [Trichonephila clavipes]|nr:RNA-directed DNA polymerase from mobile element jockey [Trichonephila clavipes]
MPEVWEATQRLNVRSRGSRTCTASTVKVTAIWPTIQNVRSSQNPARHVNPHTPTLNHVEATTVTITPQNTNPVSITSIYIPPRSDNRLFTLDLETILQINSNCVIFGDFNATHSEWNCSHNSTRGTQLKTFAETTNLEIAFPASHTRYGHNSANTLDFALISNFNFPYTIESISELSSDHNPVMINFNKHFYS